jgi:glyoxylase-like metal-dependent hydrolase (beta-lactamase superfamily II)
VLDVTGRPRILHTGRHKPGHCVVATDGAVFVGDLLCTVNPLTGRRGPQVLPRALNRSTAEMFDALAKVEHLDGTMYPAHGEAWTAGMRDAVARAHDAGAS